MKNLKQFHRISFLSIILLIVSLSSCGHAPKNSIQEGDLLFQNLQCGPLCTAIEAVTQGVDGKNFSHCALVVKINDTLRVVEAIGNSVQVHSLKTFFARSGDTNTIRNITVERLKKRYTSLIPGAQTFALQQVGQPYDDDFILNNGKWYCSELIYAAFKYADKGNEVFTMEPMTFKDPNTKKFFPAWVDYYKALNEPIPEGLPGTNPGLISRSPKLFVVPVRKMAWE